MTLLVRCPKCKGSITIEASQTRIECPQCGAKIRRNPRPESAPAPISTTAIQQARTAPAENDDYKLAADLVPLEPDLIPLAPDPAPTRTSSAPQPLGLTKKAENRSETNEKKAPGTSPLVVGIGVGVGALVFVVGIVVGGYLISNMSRGAAKAVAQQASARKAEQKANEQAELNFVQVFDKPLADVPPAEKVETKPLFVAAPPLDPQTALRRERASLFQPAILLIPAEQAANSDPPRWSVPADPAPQSEPVTYASDLRIPLNQCGAYEGPRLYPPVLADMDGPFAALAPAWESPVFENKVTIATKGKAKTTVTLVPKPSALVPVVDLRTGKTVGEFDFRVPIARSPVLSPDAAYLVGPDAVPDQIAQVAHAELFTLFVWKQRAEKPTAKLKVPGSVAWLGFFSSDHLAVITYDRKPLVQVWDVGKGKLEKSIYLTAEQLVVPSLARELEGLDRRVNAFYHRQQGMAGVSPGGRYLVVGGKSTATVVDLAEGREIGTVLVDLKDNHIGNYRGISFSPDGKEFTIWTWTRLPLQEAGQAETYSLTEGRKLRQLVSTTLSPGPLVPGPAPDIVVATGAQFGGLATYSTAIDLVSGRAEFHLPAFLRWSPSGPVVAIGRMPEPGKPAPEGADAFLGAGEGAFGVYSIPDAQSRMLAGCGLTEHGLPKRPKLVTADRSGVQTLAVQAPANWSPLPEVKPLVAPAEKNLLGPSEWPDAFSDTRAASLRMSTKEKQLGLSSIRYYETTWDQFDLVSGKPAREPIVVAPWAVKPGTYPQRKYLAALTADGQMLAMDDLETPGRIDVWSADGKHVVAFLPYGVPAEGADLRGTKAVIEWLGWSAEGRLLTLADGKLTAWDIPAAKAVWEIEGGYSLPLEFAPARTWLAASTMSGLDLLDPVTGQLLNRCAVGTTGRITDIAHSADGGQLAALFVQQSDVADSFNERKVVPEGGDAVVALWDLKSGDARVTHSQRVERFAFLHWGSHEHLAICGPVTRVLDLRLGIVPVQVMFPYTNPFPERGFPLNRGPDGRVWAAVLVASPTPTERYYYWRPHAVPDFQGEKEGPYVTAERQYFDASKAKVRFECSVGDQALGERAGEAVIKSLQMAGFQIGPGEWVLRVTHQVTDTGGSFMNGVNIPKIVYQWELKDAKGSLIWKDTSEGLFPGQSSKYFRKPTWKEKNQPVEFGTTVEHFEFGAREPREAIIAEIRERGSGVVGLHHKIPTAFFKSGDKFLEQPVSVAFNVEPPAEKPQIPETTLKP